MKKGGEDLADILGTDALALVRDRDVVNQQSAYSGSVVVSTASEDIGNPVVSGHSLFGFILSHWEVLAEKITYVVLPAF